MKFTKMQGLGNDFIIVDGLNDKINGNYGEIAAKLCDRHFGIGADGLIVILPSDHADVCMRIFNFDGSEPEMCGNGIRCFARYVYEKHIVRKASIRVETLAGIVVPHLIFADNEVVSVKVDMGEPILARECIPMQGVIGTVIDEPIAVDADEHRITCVSMGNPHCITYVSDVKLAPINDLGPKIENHPAFPRKTNVEFVEVVNRHDVNMRVWERGVGETLACGTGACAVGVACVLNKLTERDLIVHLPGGAMEIDWAEDNHVYMTGPANYVFSGDVDI